MTPDGDLSPLTLEQFRRGAASPHPMPAGVAIAAVSASFALGLVAKVLAVSARRNTLPQNTAGLEPVIAAAQAASQRMLQLSGADTAAFEAYLTAKRLPRATETERRARQEAIDVAVRHAIDLPPAATQEAAAGLQLCSDGCRFVPPALAADVGVAATLLASALRSFLLCAQSNVRQLAPDAASYRERLAIETKRHEQALRQAEAVLGHARTVVAEAPMAGVQP